MDFGNGPEHFEALSFARNSIVSNYLIRYRSVYLKNV